MTGRKPVQSILGTILVMWVAVGCGTATATPTPTPAATAAPTPAPTPTPTVGPGDFPRKFHVEGNAFVDQFDQKMSFRGMASLDPVLQKDNPSMPAWNEGYYRSMASWGANIIRVPILPLSVHLYGINTVLRVLDQTIAWAGAHKMYVIIDYHTFGWIPDNVCLDVNPQSCTTPQEWTDFWTTISRHYAGNDVVAFYELFNEPSQDKQWLIDRATMKSSWVAWKGVVDTLIGNAIRPNDAAKIILVGGLHNAYDLSFAAAAPITDASNNVAYSEHCYASLDLSYSGGPGSLSDWDKAYGTLSSKYPVFATELGYGDSTMDPPIGGVPYHQAIIDYLEAHHISWTAWGFSYIWGPGLVKDDRTLEPSMSGTYFRSRLLELNFPGLIPPPLPTPFPTPTGKLGELAHGKPATASSIEQSDYPASGAVDGDSFTRWGSAYSDPQWVQVDLGRIYDINRVVLTWFQSYATAYQIQVSSDGSHWETIYSTTTGDGGIDDLSVSGSGRYVRMYGTSRVAIADAYPGTLYHKYGYSLYEFEIYGAP